MAKAQKYRDVVPVMHANGWTHLRTVGSHERWGNESGLKFTIAAHKSEVSSGQIAQLIKILDTYPQNWR